MVFQDMWSKTSAVGLYIPLQSKSECCHEVSGIQVLLLNFLLCVSVRKDLTCNTLVFNLNCVTAAAGVVAYRKNYFSVFGIPLVSLDLTGGASVSF